MRRSGLAYICFWLLLGAVPTMAQQAACPLDYPTFEPAVPHNDLESCPDAMPVEGAYCRVSVAAEIATVFAFSQEDDCIVATKTFYPEDYDLIFG